MSKFSGRQPIHEIQVGAAKARIYRHCTPDGFPYLYFEVGRETKTNPFLGRFFDRDAQDAAKVVAEAAAWIKKNPSAADEHWSAPAPEVSTNGNGSTAAAQA